MKFLIILTMCVLAAVKTTLQSGFSRRNETSTSQKHLYNVLMFGTIGLMFLPTLFDGNLHPYTLIFGFAVGAGSVIFQFFYLKAFSTGRVTLTIIINNFSMLMPMIFSVIFYDERFTHIKIVATILAAISFFLVVKSDKNEKKEKNGGVDPGTRLKWLLYTMIVFVSGGLCSIAQRIYAIETAAEIQVFEFISVSYISATLISLIMFGFGRVKHRDEGCKVSRKMVISACLVGLTLGVFQCLNTYAPSVIEGTVLYPAYNSGLSVIVALVGAIVFKERLTVKQYVGTVIGIAAVVLLCM